LKAVADDIGSECIALPLDLTKPADVATMVKTTTDRFGPIDILFANAGSYVAGEVASGDPEEWDRVVDINVKSVFRAVRAVLPDMIARRSGDIVVTSSISGHQAIHWEPIYSATKHAVQSFVHGVRRQIAQAQCADRIVGAGDGLKRALGPDRSGRDRASDRRA
jgi:ribitol 2-dehydrogenase